MIAGQNWSSKFDPIAGTSQDIYKDVLAFHFSKDGKLISQFGLDTRENNSFAKDYGAGQYFIEGANPQNLYWILLETNGM